MEVTNELIDRLSHLARLEFNQQEKEAIRTDLQKMIAFVEKLNELDTTNVEPLIHLTPNVNIFREDVVVPSITREEGLMNAPAHNNIFFQVPKVIKK